MSYPCGIIRDLLPLYIDDVCNEESRQAVEHHIVECEKCKKYLEDMKVTDGFTETRNDISEDLKMMNSLKNIKNKMNKKIRMIVFGAVVAVVVFMVGHHLLFQAAIKEISPVDVSVSAEVYSLMELVEHPLDNVSDSESVTIFSDEEDNSEIMDVNIPGIGKIDLTKNTIEKCKYATVISFNSELLLKTIKKEIKDNTIYITAFKTTLLGSETESYQKQICTLEFQEINKIVFVDDDGMETVLWSR